MATTGQLKASIDGGRSAGFDFSTFDDRDGGGLTAGDAFGMELASALGYLRAANERLLAMIDERQRKAADRTPIGIAADYLDEVGFSAAAAELRRKFPT